MSRLPVTSHAPSDAAAFRDELDRVLRRSAIVGAAVLAICVIGAFFSPEQFFRAYLAAYQLYVGIALGSLVILMIYHLTGGAWGLLIQRILEAATRTLPLLAVLFIPIACGVHYLYLWADPHIVAESRDMPHRHVYLNVPFFCGRAALFFALWTGFAYLLSYWSRRQDETGDERFARRQSHLAGPGLVVFGITMTFAAVDWIMSLQADFHSTIYGPLVASGQILTGQAVALIALAWVARRPALSGVMSEEVLNDLGSLLFTFLVVWAYMVWFQFMLIWIANLPYEVIWYLPRSRGGWQWVAWALCVFHFAIPFFLLLMRDVKRDLPTLSKVAWLLVVTQLAYDYYLVMPSFPDTHIWQHWMDFLMPVALGGLWLANFLWELGRQSLMARRPEDRAEAVHLREIDEEAATRPQEMQHG